MAFVAHEEGDLRYDGHGRAGRRLTFTFDGSQVEAYEGETVAAALLAAGQRQLRTTERRAEPRGLFCNMGVCFECLVTIDGRANQLACRAAVADGMRVVSQQGPATKKLPS
jgi:predicted molibdopterin-dependent oxidoreductase YjgC